MIQLLDAKPVSLYPCYLCLRAGHIAEAQEMFEWMDGWMNE